MAFGGEFVVTHGELVPARCAEQSSQRHRLAPAASDTFALLLWGTFKTSLQSPGAFSYAAATGGFTQILLPDGSIRDASTTADNVWTANGTLSDVPVCLNGMRHPIAGNYQLRIRANRSNPVGELAFRIPATVDGGTEQPSGSSLAVEATTLKTPEPMPSVVVSVPTFVPNPVAAGDISNLALADRSFVLTNLLGQFVVQLAGVQFGTDDGQAITEPSELLAEFERLTETIGRVVVVHQMEFDARNASPDSYVLVLAQPFATKAAAQSACTKISEAGGGQCTVPNRRLEHA